MFPIVLNTHQKSQEIRQIDFFMFIVSYLWRLRAILYLIYTLIAQALIFESYELLIDDITNEQQTS